MIDRNTVSPSKSIRIYRVYVAETDAHAPRACGVYRTLSFISVDAHIVIITVLISLGMNGPLVLFLPASCTSPNLVEIH